MLLLHGITSFGGTWDWIVPELAERFRVLRLDFRGHGASDRAPDGYRPAAYLGDAVTTIEQVAGQPCVVMGHSLGGITAATVAQQRPDLVRAVVMEDPPLRLAPAASTGSGPLEGNALLDSFRVMRDSLPALQASGVAVEVLAGILAAAPSADGGTLGTRLHPDALVSMAGSLLTVDVTVLDPVLSGTIESSFDPTAPIEPPGLLVAADPMQRDAVADVAVARALAAISPALEVLVIDGAGHLIHDELGARETFRTAVVGFLDRVVP
jgi:pimeloyl-ACP methyl ester carboxylesterase